MTLLEIFQRKGWLNGRNVLAEGIMKTCTNCGQKRPNQKFIEQCGDQKIVNFMCEECREKSRITPDQSNRLIQSIGKKLFA
jgi:hypothetical protein